MGGFRSSTAPYKNCPVCGKRLGSSDNPYPAWSVYKAHITTTHPEFAKFNKKVQSLYLLSVVAAFGPVLVAAAIVRLLQLAQGNTIIQLSFAPVFVWIISVFLFERKGTGRFRAQWNAEHGSLPGSSRLG